MSGTKSLAASLLLVAGLSLARGEEGETIFRELKAQDRLASAAHRKITYEAHTAQSNYRVQSSLDFRSANYRRADSDAQGDSTAWSQDGWHLRARGTMVTIESQSDIKVDPWLVPDGLGPLIAEGRGLSQITQPKIVTHGDEVVLEGVLKGHTLRALLDPHHHYAARQVEILNWNRTAATYTYRQTSPHADAHGYAYFGDSECRSAAVQAKVKIEELSTGTPDLTLPAWLHRGGRVLDHRVPGGVLYTYEDILRLFNGKTPSLAELLVVSQRERGQLDARKGSDQRMANQILGARHDRANRRLAQVVLLFLAAVGFILTSRWLRRRPDVARG